MNKGFSRSIFSATQFKRWFECALLNKSSKRDAFSSEKGFMFSIDALLAIALIVSASLAFAMLVQESDSELLLAQDKRIAASDDAIVGFYLKNITNVPDGVSSFIDSKKTAYCSKAYSYDFSTTNAASVDFCEGN